MKKILTILVPVYNVEKYLKRCLDSILIDDILDDIEIITVNDGGSDSSIDILKEYKKKYPNNIIIIDKENGGHGSTINKGIELSTAKYFRVLDSDDWFNSEDFIKFVNLLKCEDSDLIITNYSKEEVYNGKSVYIAYNGLKSEENYIFDSFDLALLKENYFVMATSTYKTSLLRESGLKLPEHTFYVDMIYNVVPMSKVKTFKYYDLDIYRYYIGRKDQSVNTSSFVKNHMHHDMVIKTLIEFYNVKNNYSDNYFKYLELIIKYTLYTHYCIYMYYFTNKKEAIKYLKNFDAWLKKNNIKLYKMMDSMKDIKINRKSNFRLIRYNNSILKRVKHVIKRLLGGA